MKILWLSDIHLNFLTSKEIAKFIASLSVYNADGLVITGDIGTGPSIVNYLKAFIPLDIPVYFVLGNHDFYSSYFSPVRSDVKDVSVLPHLVYLTEEYTPIQLTNDTVLVGVNGWADGRYGNLETSKVFEMIGDFEYISSFFGISMGESLELMQELAGECAEKLNLKLSTVKDSTKRVIIATHVPPFREACIHMGKVSDEDWLPFFSSKVLGDVILTHAAKHPNIDFTVLCGHTHGEGECKVADNVHVITAKAEYNHPCVYRELEI